MEYICCDIKKLLKIGNELLTMNIENKNQYDEFKSKIKNWSFDIEECLKKYNKYDYLEKYKKIIYIGGIGNIKFTEKKEKYNILLKGRIKLLENILNEIQKCENCT